MSKYISADKLIAEIEKLLAKAKNDEEKAFAKKDAVGHLAAVTKTAVCVKIKKLITSLQQEQPDKRYCEEHCKGYKETGGKCFFEWNCSAIKQQEQSEVDLEKELKKWRHDHFKGKRDGDYSGEYLERESQLDIAHHFYELGQRTKYQQIRAEFAKPKSKEYQDGNDEGCAKGFNARKEESVGVAESPLKTFPRVNEFDCGSSYRH